MLVLLAQLCGLSCLQIDFVNLPSVLLAGLSNRVYFFTFAHQITPQTIVETYHLMFETMRFDPLPFYPLHNYVIQVVSVSDASAA